MAFIGTDLTAAQKTGLAQDRYLENRLLEMIKLEKNEFPFHMLGKDYVIPANQGTKTVQFRRYLALPQFADGHALTEGVPPTEPLLTEAVTVSATVAQYGAFMRLTDVQEALHIDNIKAIYQPELARHAAELIERNVIKVLVGEASLYFANNAATATAFLGSDKKLTWLDLRKVALYMKNQLRMGNTRTGGKPVVVVHPNIMQDLLDEAAAMNHVFAAGQDNAPIKIGTLENFQLFGVIVQEALIAPVVKGSDVPGFDAEDDAAEANDEIYISIMLGKDPYIVTTLANGSVQFKMTGYEATKDDPLGQFATVGYKLWTGAKVIDPIAIYAIYSYSGYGTITVADQITDMDTTVAGNQAVYEKAEAAQTSTDNYTAGE